MNTDTLTTISPSSTTPGTSFDPSVGTFNTQSTPGGPAFVMSSTSWITLQAYLAFVKNLPSTTAELSTEMGTGAPATMTDFDKLITLYVSMQADGANFSNRHIRTS